MRHPRTHAWETAAGIAAGGAVLSILRTTGDRPLRSAPTLAAAGAGMAAGGLMVYEWFTPILALRTRVLARSHSGTRGPLTFDDGPCHPYTEQLLEILDQE